jgi:hypothetical protein
METTKAVADADDGIADQAVFRGIADLARVISGRGARLLLTQCHIPCIINTKFATTESNSVSDEIVLPPPARGRRRLFQPGQSGNPAGRGRGSRNKATLAAATLLDGEALGLTRRAVEAALAGENVGDEAVSRTGAAAVR